MQKLRLTYPQQNILLVEKVNKNLPINSIVGSIEISANFDEKICNDAINYVIKNNDAMRINIVSDCDQTYQFVKDFEYTSFEVINLSLYSESKIKEYINDCALLPLFLEKNGLYEFKIFNYGSGKGAIFMKIHHIISDAWSCSKIGTQLIEYIMAKLNNEELRDEPKPSYVEFIQKEIEYENTEKYIKDEEFWKSYLENIKEAVSLSNVSNDIFDTNAKRYNVKLDEKLNERINEYCKENKISPFTLFMAALSTYIYRTKEENDFVIGTPLLNRSNFKEKQMLGMFISTIPMRIKVNEGISFLDLSKQIGRNNLELFRHQKYPYSKILEHIHSNTKVKSNLYNIILSYQNARSDMVNSDIYSTTWPFVNNISDELQIHIMDMDNTGVLNINYDYKTSLFTETQIKYLHSRIIAIIEDAIDNICIDVESIKIMSKSEEDTILKEFNNTTTKYPKDKTLIEMFEDKVKINPEKIALVFEGKKLTYNELNEKANKLAFLLRNEKNIKENDIVAIMIDKSFELIISILACLKCGAAYLPIEKNYPKDRIEYMLNNSNCNYILTDSLVDLEINTNLIDVKAILGKNKEYGKVTISKDKYNSESIVYVMYTSGTTGNPKGVLVTNRNIMRLVINTNYIEFKEQDAIIQTGATVFDASTLEIWGALLNGLSLYLIKKENLLNPKYLENYLAQNNITIMWLTAPLFNQMVDYNVNMFKNLRVLLVGGDVLSVKHINKMLENCPNVQIINGYGPTENTTFSMCYKIKDKTTDSIPIGKPVSNSFGYIVDSKLRLLPMYVKGELLVGGDGVAKGYLNEKETVNESFITDPFNNGKNAYKTGDIAYFQETGDIKFCGRKDHQFKIRGFRIELGEIKHAILKLSYIKDVFVTALKDKNDEYKIYAYYISNKNIEIEDLKQDMKNKLPEYMIPNFFVKVNEIPLNQNGKVDKDALINQNASAEISSISNKPCSQLQIDISNVIKNILKISDIDVSLSLFNFGMDSLSAIKLSIELSNKFNVEISTKDIFENNTIEMLEKIIATGKTEKIHEQEKEIYENYPLTDAQTGIFIDCMKNPELLSYNVPFELILDDEYDLEYIKESLEKLIKANKVFFTQFISKDGNIYQKLKLHDIDIAVNKNLSKKEYEKYKNKFVRKFDLLNDTLYRVSVCRVEEKICILFDIHHIIFDGSSIIILIKELEKILAGENINEKESVFSKKAIDEAKQKNTDKYLKSRKYVMDKFKNELGDSNIPYDFSIVKNEKRKSLYEEFTLNHEEKVFLENYAKQNNITLNNIFLGVFSIILSKYSNSNNILLGIGSTDRKTKEELGSIGMFVKTLLFNFNIDYESKLSEYFANIQKEMIDTINHDLFTYTDFMKENSKENKYRDNLLKTMFIYQNIASSKKDFNKIKLNEIETNVAKFDFVCQVIPNENDIKIKLEYDKSLYSKKTIERFGKAYIYVLSKIKDYIENKNKLSKIEIVSLEEKEILLEKFNDTVTNYPKSLSISQIFEKQVKKFADTAALVLNDKTLSYDNLNKEANKFARFLREKLKIEKNESVSIVADKSFETVIGIIGIIKSGACYLPIDSNLPDDRIDYMIKNSSSKVIINTTTRKLDFIKKDKNNLNEICIFDIKNLNLNEFSDENLENINTPEDLAYIMYTSGSTGRPKGCMNTHKGAIKLVKNINYLDIDKVSNVFLAGNLVFDASLHEMWLCLLNGKTGVIITKDEVLTPVKYKSYFEKYNNILAIFTTQLFHQYASSMPDLFKNAKYVICGGDVLLYKYVEKVKKVCENTNIINIYGPAECSAAATTFNVDEIINKDINSIPIGKPISNTRCYVLDSTLNLCPINMQGELYIGGDGVGKGYINNPELTQKVFIDNKIDKYSNKLYKTGDFVKWTEDGILEFLGREDRQVKIRGYRVEIAEIENVALEFGKIKEVKVVLQNKDLNKKLIMYFTSDTKIDESSLRKYIADKLPSYMLPDYFIQLEKIPLTLNGKIDVRNLPNANQVENDIINEFVEPKNDIEVELENIICRLLNLEKVSINSNLLDIGLDSINITRLCIEAMNKNLNITYADVFEYPTIEKLANLINSNSEKDYNYNIEEYDYSQINNLLEREVEYTKLKNEDILITGVNGFLGAHVLAEFLDNYTGIAYCVVRGKLNNTGYERLKSILKYYFKDKYDLIIEKRVKIIDVEITSKRFEEVVNNAISNTNVNKIINCAAKVKHFGRFEDFYKLNVESVKKLINISLKNKIKLIHISTLSVSGNGLEGGVTTQKLDKKIKFTEKDLYVGQNINNVYSYSKFLAEREILESVINNKLNATIIRVGNLMGRYSDGKFQRNKNENAFIERIKFLADKKIINKNIAENTYIELSPIDLTAKAILSISNFEKCEYIYHVYNYNHYQINDLLNYFENQKNIHVKVLSDEEFYDKLEYEIKNNNKISSTIITDLNSDKKIDYSSSINITHDITQKIYEKINFKWNIINEEYLNKFFRELNI